MPDGLHATTPHNPRHPSPPLHNRPNGRDPEVSPKQAYKPAGDENSPGKSALDVALALAADGWPVFPCTANKKPAIPEAEGGRGYLDAATDPQAVRQLFARAPHAKLVGVPTGARTGLLVIDIDPRHQGDVWEAENTDQLPVTRIHSTMSGGCHRLYRYVEGIRGRTNCPARGVDVRAEGNYIIMPPSTGYMVLTDAPIAPCPGWLLDKIRRAPPPPPRPFTKTDPDKITDKRLDGVVRSLLARITNAPEGLKHETLRSITITLGGYADLLPYGSDQLITLAVGALPDTVKDWDNARKTAAWGVAEGRKRPLDIEDRPYQRANANGKAHTAPPEPEPEGSPKTNGRILLGDDFMTGFEPPDWLIDGIVQRGKLYACTSLTGHGKTAVWLYIACMIHAGRMVGNLDAIKGNVLYLAGENPEDLKARMHGMVGTFKLKPMQLPYVLPATFPMSSEEVDALIREIKALDVPITLIVGDTASSFFPGDDENDNVQAGAYARTLRRLTLEVPGNPTVVALCHPVKNAAKSNLLPRGGGAFLNELDVNLTLWSESQGEVTELHWQGKIRGPDFAPFGFRLNPVPTGFIDRKDRPVMTIVAEPMSEEALAEHKKQTLANTDVVLKLLRSHPDWSWSQMAREVGWIDGDQPLKGRVQRAIASLSKDKLIERKRDNAPWTLTPKGEEVIAGNNHG